MYKNHSCLIWKSNGISFNNAKVELKKTFRVFDNVISDKQVKSLIK